MSLPALAAVSGGASRSKASLPYTSRKDARTSYVHASSSSSCDAGPERPPPVAPASAAAARDLCASSAWKMVSSARGSTPICSLLLMSPWIVCVFPALVIP